MAVNVLLTGATGGLGRTLVSCLLAKGGEVIALARDTGKAKSLLPKDVRIVQGDILSPGCGVTEDLPQIAKLYHLAALVDLAENKQVWEINYEGTRNVSCFAVEHNIPQFYFVSTAYANENGRNLYEKSKAMAEFNLRNSEIPKVFIIKPSIITGNADQTVNHVALAIAKVHHSVEFTRQKVQDKLALPPLELGFRIKGDPKSTLNIIPAEVVADAIANLPEEEGTYWITNPNPPSLEEVAGEVGEAIGLNVHITPKFRPSPPEKLIERLIQPFLPYMAGEPSFPTVIDGDFKLHRGYVMSMVKAFLN